MKLESLRDLFSDELKDIDDAETQITKALPKTSLKHPAVKIRRR